LAEYLQPPAPPDAEAVAYRRAYEDFRGFVTEPVWDIVRELASDGAQQAVLRTTLHHWLLVYGNMRRAWNEIITGRYALPDLVWPPPDRPFQAGAKQTHAEMEEELGAFCMQLTRPSE